MIYVKTVQNGGNRWKAVTRSFFVRLCRFRMHCVRIGEANTDALETSALLDSDHGSVEEF